MISAIISRSCGERAVVLGKSVDAPTDGPKCDEDDCDEDDDEVVAVVLVVTVDNICAAAAV